MPYADDEYLERLGFYISVKQFMLGLFLFLSIIIPLIFWIDYRSTQTVWSLIVFITMIILFPSEVVVFSYLLVLDLVHWRYLRDTICERYSIPDVETTRAIEEVLRKGRVDFHQTRDAGKLPDRSFHSSLRLFYEIFDVPQDGTRIIVSRTMGPPEEQFTRVFFGQSDNRTFQVIKCEIQSALMEIEGR
jgi:hypothetical protein